MLTMPKPPSFELELIREVPITAEEAFAGWTVPDVLMQWFCPRPWKVVEAQIDLRAGGLFATTMQSPEGHTMPRGEGCLLLVEAPHRLVWTNFMRPDFCPQPLPEGGFGFVCDLRFEPTGAQSIRYHATVRHLDEAGCERHRQMGFEAGWGAALDQLVELSLSRRGA